MPDVKCISHNSRKSPVVTDASRLQRHKIANNSHQLPITNIPIEINPEIFKKIDLAQNTVQPLVHNGEINRGSIKNNYTGVGNKTEKAMSEKEKIALSTESQDKFDGEITDTEKLMEQYVNCKDECEKTAIATALTTKSNQIGETYEEHYNHLGELAANIEAHPKNTNKNNTKAVSVLLSRAKKSGGRFKRNIEALYVLNPKLFSGLKPLIEKTSKLIDKLKFLSSKFEEFKRKYFDEKNNELIGPNEDDELSGGRKFSISKNLTDAFVDGLLEQDKTEKKEAREKLDNLVVQKKKEEETDELLFEKIMRKNRENALESTVELAV